MDDLAASEPALIPLINALNDLEAGLGDKLLTSNLYADISSQVTNFTFAYEYGLTKNITAGIRAPIITRDYKVKFNALTIDNTPNGALTRDHRSAIQQDSRSRKSDISGGCWPGLTEKTASSEGLHAGAVDFDSACRHRNVPSRAREDSMRSPPGVDRRSVSKDDIAVHHHIDRLARPEKCFH